MVRYRSVHPELASGVGSVVSTFFRRFPGGTLIDFPYREVDAKIAATSDALQACTSFVLTFR